MSMSDTPPASVRAAFGGATGGLVFKPGQHRAVGSWLASVCTDLRGPGFVVPQPVRATDGSWVVEGWAAWTKIDGAPDPLARWPELVAASEAFHAALADVPAPGWLGRGRDRWTVADRVAWGETQVELAPELADLVAELRAATRPVRSSNQLVHGNLADNVLFADGQPPAVIDFAPSWRPAGYPVAVAAVDLLAWSGAPPTILDELADHDQLLLRALIYRLVTESLGRPDAGSRQAVREANDPVADLLLSRVTGRPATIVSLTDPDIATVAARVLGCRITGLRPVEGGHSRSVTRIAERAADDPVFIKAAGDLDTELAVYEALAGNPFLPRLLASTHEPVPMLVLEALAPAGWVRDWTPQLVDATRTLLHEVHALPAPPGVPVLDTTPNPWDAIAADPTRLLRMGACSDQWLATHIDTLHAAAATARTEGESLIHRDVRAANLWCHQDRLVLVDWASAAIGDPWLDHHLWLVALHAEGGPPPDTGQGEHATGHAALIAGQQPLLTPAREANPALFGQRCRRLAVALSWGARLLRIPPPTAVHSGDGDHQSG